jgi:hypothetical protein
MEAAPMNPNDRRLTQLPVLSHIQQVTMTQNLPLAKRLVYILVSTLAIWAAFALVVGVGIALVILLFDLSISAVESTNDVVILTIPVIVTFVALIGYSSHPTPAQIKPGDSLARTVTETMRSGLIMGLLGGFVFGLTWNLAMKIGALYIELNTIFSGNFQMGQIFVYSVILGLSMAPTFAVFRTFTAVIGHLVLYMIARDDVVRQIS